MVKHRTSPSVRLRRLAAQLRELREAAGMSQEEVAERTGKDRSTMYRIENATSRPQRSTLIQLLDLYGVDEPRRGELLTLLKESGQRGWLQQYRSELPDVYSDYIALEDEAWSISNYQALNIPGLLQTEAYARAKVRGTLPYATAEEVETRVATRIERQSLLDRQSAPKLWAILDEAALRRIVGSREVMRDQARYLLEAAARPNVTIQVISYAAGAHPGMDGAFVILDFMDAGDASIVYIESAAGGLFLEEEAELRRYTLMFDYLRANALGIDATAALLRAVAEQA
jgi:transcriptional regulator with XRE-family HTH domain